MIVQFECADEKVGEVLEAIKGMIKNPKLFSPQPLPPSQSANEAFEDLAQKIAKKIKPKSSQPMRKEAIRAVLGGHDTFWDQKGQPDPALRNATGALSKALRTFAPYTESPLEILCERRREVFPDGPTKGLYRGTRYIPNKLGRRVREILIEQNAF